MKANLSQTILYLLTSRIVKLKIIVRFKKLETRLWRDRWTKFSISAHTKFSELAGNFKIIVLIMYIDFFFNFVIKYNFLSYEYLL